jgi:glycerol-3-phosphate cytidylyltransferase
MTRVLTFGTFDLLHYGHLRLLERIYQMSSFLMVGLSTDELVIAGGKKPPFYPYRIRKEMLLHTLYVNEVIAHKGPVDNAGRVKVIHQKINIIQANHIELVVMGNDWSGEYDFLQSYCRVIYLPRTEGISTTLIRERLASNEFDNKQLLIG